MKGMASIVFLLLGSLACPGQEQEQKDWTWVNEHFSSVLEEVMPMRERLGFFSIAYRSRRDLYTDELEVSIVFNEDFQEKYLTAVLREADSVSIYDQIMALHAKNPTESIEDIKKQLKVKELRFSEKTCPVLRREYDKFYKLTLSMRSSDDRAARAAGKYVITLHPRVHTFRADISGGSLEVVLSQQDHPFVVWAAQVRSTLEACRGNAQESEKKDD